jgi:hypothetical protein
MQTIVHLNNSLCVLFARISSGPVSGRSTLPYLFLNPMAQELQGCRGQMPPQDVTEKRDHGDIASKCHKRAMNNQHRATS